MRITHIKSVQVADSIHKTSVSFHPAMLRRCQEATAMV